MGLIRLITFGLLIWILWFMYKNYVAKKAKQQQKPNRLNSSKVVRCRYCDVHLPETDAVQNGSDWFCSQQHKKEYLEKQ